MRSHSLLGGGSTLNSEANLAYVSVILKLGKEHSDVGNYTPMSLINNNLKILTKIMANRLLTFIGGYVHKDQVGFIPVRQGLDHIRRAVYIISLLWTEWDGGFSQEGYLLSADLQKALDAVGWSYLFEVLSRWGFGPHFCRFYWLYTLTRVPKSNFKAITRTPFQFLKVLDRGALFTLLFLPLQSKPWLLLFRIILIYMG